jgi:hypothetical protein
LAGADPQRQCDLLSFMLHLPPELRDEMAAEMHWIDGVSSTGHEVFGLLHKAPFFSGLSNVSCIRACAMMRPFFHKPMAEPNATLEERLIVGALSAAAVTSC